jgi:hypothetical protein
MVLNFLKKNWFKITILFFIVFVFYWFGYRPQQIVKHCNEKSIKDYNNFAKTNPDAGEKELNLLYLLCLRDKGYYK